MVENKRLPNFITVIGSPQAFYRI